jgi:hypothetical protein
MPPLRSALLLMLASGCGGVTLASSDGTPDGGTARDGAAIEAATVPSCGACLDERVGWAFTGASLSPDTSEISPCRAYSHTYSFGGDALHSTTCHAELSCDDASSMAAILTNPDVFAASRGDVDLYGSNPIGCDGSLLRVTLAGHTFGLGDDCTTDRQSCSEGICVPVPAGLRALATTLTHVDHELERPPAMCE